MKWDARFSILIVDLAHFTVNLRETVIAVISQFKISRNISVNLRWQYDNFCGNFIGSEFHGIFTSPLFTQKFSLILKIKKKNKKQKIMNDKTYVGTLNHNIRLGKKTWVYL